MTAITVMPPDGDCCNAECRFFIVMPIVNIIIVPLLSVFMLSLAMLGGCAEYY
jgi:hypothetical protein